MNPFNVVGPPEKMLGAVVIRLREKHQLTLREMSKQLGISPSFLNLIENGERCPKKEFAFKLAKAMGETPVEQQQIENEILLGIVLYHFPGALVFLNTQGEKLNSQAREVIRNDIESQKRDIKSLSLELQLPTENYLREVLLGESPITRQQIYELAKKMNVPPQKYLLHAGYIPYEALSILNDSPSLINSLLSSPTDPSKKR